MRSFFLHPVQIMPLYGWFSHFYNIATHPSPSEISGDGDRGIADGYVVCHAVSIHHGRRRDGRSGEHVEDDSGFV